MLKRLLKKLAIWGMASYGEVGSGACPAGIVIGRAR